MSPILRPGLLPVQRLLAVAAAGILAAPLFAQDVQTLFQEGVQLYRSGDYEAAIAKLREVVRLDPGREDAMALLQSSEDQEALLQLLQAGGEFETFAREILARSAEATREALRDADAAEAAAAGVFGDSYAERSKALFALRTQFGPFGVTPLVARLASPKEADRYNAIYALSRMGREATVPMLAASRSEDAQVRLGVLQALAALDDPRAEARFAEMAAGDEDPTVRAFAGKLVSGDAGELCYRQGWAFYAHDPDLGLVSVENHGVLWSCRGARLEWREMPAAVVPVELAKEWFQRALGHGHPDAAFGLALAYGTELAVLGALVEAGGEDQAALRDSQATAAQTLGQGALERALAAAISRSDVSTAEALVDLLGGPGLVATDSLRQAVASGVPSLRFGSALALAAAGDASAEVVAALADALGLQALRVVVLVDADAARRGLLAGELAGRGVVVLESGDGAGGLIHLHRSAHVDAIVVADQPALPDMYARRFVLEARKDPRHSEAPLLVLAGAETGEIADATALEAPEAGAIVDAFGALNGQRRSHLATAQAAADALAQLARCRPEAVAAAAGALAAALGREDEVSVPCMEALAFSGGAGEAAAAQAVVADRGRSAAARAAAAGALAGILSRDASAAVDHAILQAAMAEGEAVLSRACGRALALAGGGHLPATDAARP